MAQTSPMTQPTREQRLEQIKTALDAALRFPPSRASDLTLGPAQLQEAVATEVAFGKVVIEETGLTAGMQIHLLQPANAFLRQWLQVRNSFDLAIEPVMKNIDADTHVQVEVANLKQKRDDEIEQAERQFLANQKNVDIKQEYDDAKQLSDKMKNQHENREPNMFGLSKLYYFLIVLIGAAEWLINYDTFFLFTGIPAIAAGATLILGFLLAFAAHSFGLIIEQWAFRFGRHQFDIDQYSTWRLFGLSLVGLAVVLIAAGGSRYSAALHALSSETQPNILGADVAVVVNPTRDVLISLLANLGAWLLGVFISYVSHDVDPAYMASEKQWRKAKGKFNKAHRPTGKRKETIEAQFKKAKDDAETSARTRGQDVEAERAMLAQVRTHDNAVRAGVRNVLAANIETYKDLLAKAILSQNGAVVILRSTKDGPQPFTPFEFKALKPSVDQIMQSLAA